ncbi:MAG: NUDIX domain-containing protein [Candidatus Aenigmarchaeota archaeon]|nr:NUDIX domain-containing protein [Candidatus Aenigmarchaeota archaeon]MDI6722248.1 NUDIX domain-containing protein [Candidatus Aenigmarchaeota archaeon]
MIMIYKEQPEDFSPRFEVVSCFCEYEGKMLLLERQDGKSEGGKWGVSAGKIDKGETSMEAIQREIGEETGLFIPPCRIDYFGKVYVKYPDYDFVYHMFYAALENDGIKINHKEHKDYAWVSPPDALEMNLVMDEDECIRMFYRI